MSPSYHRSLSNKSSHSNDFSPVGRKQMPPGGDQMGQPRNAVSNRLNVVPPKGQNWRGSGSDIGGRPLSAGSRGSQSGSRQSLPQDSRGNLSPYQGRGPQDGYQQSPIQPRRADQLQASPSSMDYRGSPSQQRREMDPRYSPGQYQQHPQYSPAQQRRQDYHADRQSYPQSSRRDYDDPRNYRHSTPPDAYRQDYDPRGRTESDPRGRTESDPRRRTESDPRGRSDPYNRPSTYSSSMPRDRRDHSDSFNSHPSAQKSSTLPGRKSYKVTDLDTNESQQISPELYDRDPPSGSSSSHRSSDQAGEYFVTPETRTGESQGNPSYGGPYSTLPGSYKDYDSQPSHRDFESQQGHNYESQPGHDRYDPQNYAARSQSLPAQSKQHQSSSRHPYTVTDLDTKESKNISEVDLGFSTGNRPSSGSGNRKQAPPPQRRSDSLIRVRVSA